MLHSLIAMKLTCLVLLACLGATLAYTKSYNGYQVLTTKDVPAYVMPALMKLTENPKYDFWSHPKAGRPVSIMTGPDDIDILKDALNRMRLNPTVRLADVGEQIRREREEIEAIKKTENRGKAATYDRYMTFTEIDTFIHDVVAANPAVASVLDLGFSYEGLELHGVKISSGAGKKGVFIDCAIHAREWLGPPVCMKTIEDVIASPTLQNLADWYIVPVANPDGYSFSWTNDRLWRKTRRPNDDVGSSCIGTDPNRNFDILWNNDNNNIACSETYPGSSVWSEPETAAMRDVIGPMGASGELALYIAVHTYGAYLLYPHGWTDVPAPNNAELDAAAQKAARIIESYQGTVYTVGPSGSTLYPTFGASDDYAYTTAGVRFAYTFELPGGIYGFDPPASWILPTVEETVPGIVSIVEDAIAAAGK